MEKIIEWVQYEWQIVCEAFALMGWADIAAVIFGLAVLILFVLTRFK